MGKKQIEKLNKSDILKNTTADVIAGLSVFATLEKKDIIPSASRILQGLLKGKFLEKLQEEWKQLKEIHLTLQKLQL